MNVFELLGVIAINNQGANKAIDATSKKANDLHSRMEKAFTNIGKSAVKMGKTVAKGLATIGAAGAAVTGALLKNSIGEYAEYEQLVGGIETLFKDSQGKVMEYAKNAYKTAGLSANDYMSTVTSFSASLLQGLGGDTAAAAEMANMAVTDMSDNANKMGTDMTMIQNAYQGFAKQNYTMLDNLKLGYGGTQAEMARLINDSGVLGDTMVVTAETVNQVSFAKIIEAIHVIQNEMGITGTTAKEATETITGSFNSWKASWKNLLVGMADEENIEPLLDTFFDAGKTALGNVKKILPKIMSNVGAAVKRIGQTVRTGMSQTVWPAVQQFAKVNFGIELPEWSAIETQATTWWNSIKTGFQNLCTWTYNVFGQPTEDASQAEKTLHNIFARISDEASSLANGSLLLVQDVFEWIKDNEWAVTAAIGVIGAAFVKHFATVHPIATALAAIVASLATIRNQGGLIASAGGDLADSINNNPDAVDPSWAEHVENGGVTYTGATPQERMIGMGYDHSAVEKAYGLAEGSLEEAQKKYEAKQAALAKAQAGMVEAQLAVAKKQIASVTQGQYAAWTEAQKALGKEYVERSIAGLGTHDFMGKFIGAGLDMSVIEGFMENVQELIDEEQLTLEVADAVFAPGVQSSLQVQLGSMALTAEVKAVIDTFVTGFQTGALSLLGKDGSHASGLRYVPFDGYISELHRGEIVLPRHQADEYRRSGGNADNSALIKAIDALSDRVTSVMQQVAANTAAGHSIALDSGVLVGQLAPRLDAQLGTLTARKERRG